MNPLFLLLGLGALLGLLASDDDKPTSDALQPATGGNPVPQPPAEVPDGAEIPVSASVSAPVTLEILREIFDDGALTLRRRDAVELLKAAPYYIPKTNAYRALAPARRFAPWLREDDNGWLHFIP